MHARKSRFRLDCMHMVTHGGELLQNRNRSWWVHDIIKNGINMMRMTCNNLFRELQQDEKFYENVYMKCL